MHLRPLSFMVLLPGVMACHREGPPKALQSIQARAEKGDVEAQFLVGEAYELGLDVPRSLSKAWPWYEKAAQAGHGKAMVRTAVMLIEGRVVKQDVVRGKALIQQARGMGEPAALSALGWLAAWPPNGAQADLNEAEAFFKQAMAANFPRAYLQYGLLCLQTGRSGEDVRHLEKSFELGWHPAAETLGRLYLTGKSLPQDPVLGARWYQRGADKDDPACLSGLAYCYQFGKGVPQDAVKAESLYLRAFPRNPRAAGSLGDLLRSQGRYREGFSWYEKGVALDEPYSMSQAGMNRIDGMTVQQDIAAGMKLLRRGAELGDPDAMERLGCMFMRGEGFPVDRREARAWLQKAAELDHIPAILNLSVLALKEKKPGEYFSLNQRAATLGNWRGECNLADAYLEGLGVPRDVPRGIAALSSFQWNHPESTEGLMHLGHGYRSGKGLPKDMGEALTCFRLAAEMGDPYAMAKVALHYHHGQGVPKDLVSAYLWALAARAKEPRVEPDEYSVILKELSPSELAEAGARESAWLERYRERRESMVEVLRRMPELAPREIRARRPN